MTKTFTWIRNEADQIIALERHDDRDNSIGRALVDSRGKLDDFFRDDNGYLKGMVSEQHKKDFKNS